MKKITIILLGFIALLAVSCDKDDHLAPDKIGRASCRERV